MAQENAVLPMDVGVPIETISTSISSPTNWQLHRFSLIASRDASILQPEGDPFRSGDFLMSNPSDSWLLIETYVDRPRIDVIIDGLDLGYRVSRSEPWCTLEELEPTDELELVNYELPKGTNQQTVWALSRMEIGYQRTVYDRDGNLLWDRTFATMFYPRGNVYKVSPDMVGQSPAA